MWWSLTKMLLTTLSLLIHAQLAVCMVCRATAFGPLWVSVRYKSRAETSNGQPITKLPLGGDKREQQEQRRRYVCARPALTHFLCFLARVGKIADQGSLGDLLQDDIIAGR